MTKADITDHEGKMNYSINDTRSIVYSNGKKTKLYP